MQDAHTEFWQLTDIEEPYICSAVVAHNFGQDQIPINKNNNLHDCSW